MALMYTNTNWETVGILYGADIDCEIGESNDFQLEMAMDEYDILSAGCVVYDSEYPQFGGILESVEVDSATGKMAWHGSTFSGYLGKNVVMPPFDESTQARLARLNIAGEVGAKVERLISYTKLNDKYYTNIGKVGEPEVWAIDRFTDCYTAIRKLLNEYDYGITVWFDRSLKKCCVSASYSRRYDLASRYDTSQFDFRLSKSFNEPDHLIVLGKGELANRYIREYFLIDGELKGGYTLTDGRVRIGGSTYIDKHWNDVVYENTNIELEDELLKEAFKRFEESRHSDTLDIDPPEEIAYNIGDIIVAKENVTGLMVEKKVTKIIYRSDGEYPEIRYETGETK